MVNIDFVSDNIVIIIEELIGIQKLAKYLVHNENNPLTQPDLIVPVKDLVGSKIFTYPFDPIANTTACSNIMIYYPQCDFQADGAIAIAPIYIDIVIAKSLWLINDGKPQIRPYMIMKEIMQHFDDRSFNTLGILHFHGFTHVNVNGQFDCIRIIAESSLFGA
jgi:hypothetical protein